MEQDPKYEVGDTIQFLNANEKRPNNLGKIKRIETNLQGVPTHYTIIFTHSKVYPENRTRNRFPIVDIDNQTELVTELPAGADCPAGGPSSKELLRRRRRRGGKSLRKMKKRKLRKTRRNKRKRRI
uniref:Uncharacterized protein n=1 Tax=viral metagenome TaxID=1070528 RepID=A0A6C0HAV3_9ZZZZ